MNQKRNSDLLEERKLRRNSLENRDPEGSEEEASLMAMRVRRRTVCTKSYNPEEDLHADIRMVPKSDEVKCRLEHSLRENLLFRSLEPEQLSFLIDAMTEHNVSPGQVLIKAGDDNHGFYVIDSGTFEVLESDGVTTVTSGGLGELSLIHNQVAEHTVRSLTDGRVFMLDRIDYRKIVTKTNYELRKKLEELIDLVPGLTDLPEGEKLKVTDVLELLNFADGEVIVKEGESLNGMYMVVCGAVQLPSRVVHSGGYFGELPDLKPPMCENSATAVACGPTKIAYLNTQVYERLMGPRMTVLKKTPSKKPEKPA